MKRRTIFKSGIVLSLLSLSISILLLFSANFGYPNLEIDSWIGDEYKYWGTFMIHSEVSCDKLRRRTAPMQNTIALGCAFTTKDSLPPRPNTNSRLALFRQAYDMLPFFNIFLRSFCGTMSAGFRYKIFVAYDYDDYYLNDTVVLNKFKESFNLYTKRYCSTEGSTVELQMVYCGYSGKPAWSQNDALMKAYEDNFAYYFMVNDDTQISGSGWTEALVKGLANRFPPNFGLVGPQHIGDSQKILTHNFVHKTHVDLFSFFYPRIYETWHGDEWITRVYSPNFMNEVRDAVVFHDIRDHIRYTPHRIPEEYMSKHVDAYKNELRRLLPCLPEYSSIISLL